MIKLRTIIILFLFSVFICKAQGVNFEPSLDIAFSKVKQENKLVFIEFYNEYCHVCKTLNPFFNTKELGDFYNKNFISYKLNTENVKKVDSLFIENSGLKPESVPILFFFDADRNFIHYSSTKPDADFLITIGAKALNNEERASNLINKYNSGDRDIAFLYAYSNLAQLYKNKTLVNQLADDLFEAFPKEKLDSKTSYIITKNAVFSIENGFFIYWINHFDQLKDFEQGANKGKEITVIQGILTQAINSEERENWDLAKIKSVKEMIVKTELNTNPDVFFWQQESLLLTAQKREKEALKIFEKMMKTKNGSISSSLYILNYYLEILNDNSSLKSIKSWIDQLAKQENTPADKINLMQAYKLYYKKNKNNKKAKKIEQEIIQFSKDNIITIPESDH